MNLVSKINLIITAISFITLVIARLFLGTWMSILWWPLGIFLVGLIISLIIDFKSYWSFLTMRVTKNGMSLGFSVLILLIILCVFGYLSLLWDKTYDMTEEKIYSLSEQSLKVLDSMKEGGVRILVFYKGEEGKQLKQSVENNFDLYKQNVRHVKIEYINAFIKNKLAEEYLSSLSDVKQENIFVFVEYLSKRIRVQAPFDEEQILSAMINASRRVNKNVYFVSGHDERDLSSEHAEGAKAFRIALEKSSFNVLEWNFIEEKNKLPSDASALMILGPRRSFFEQEIKWIKEYVENNGNLFIALDPGTFHNLASFISQSLGIDFKNNFIVNPFKSMGRGEASVFGVQYDSNNSITRSFKRVVSLFDGVSEVGFSSSLNQQWTAYKLVYSEPLTFTVASMKQIEKRTQNVQSYLMAVAVQEFFTESGKEDKVSDETESKEENKKSKKDGFSAVVFGDSDFLTNRLFNQGINRDLTLNIISYLTDEDDLLSLRPRALKGTQVVLSRSAQYIFIIIAILLPLFFFILAGISWFFRKKS